VMAAIFTLLGIILQAVGFIDGVLAEFMTALRVPGNAQVILLVVAAVWLGVMAIRALGPVFKLLIIVLLLLLVAHRLAPGVDAKQFAPPAGVGQRVNI
jgi:hypothetical protein